MVSFFSILSATLGKLKHMRRIILFHDGGRIVLDKHFTSNFAEEDLYCECFDTVLGDHI